MLALLGIVFTLLVAGIAIMTTVSHPQAVSNFASYFYDYGWPSVGKWIECHPGIILNIMIGLSIAAIICFVAPVLIWIRTRQRKGQLIAILDDVFKKTGDLFEKSLDDNAFATSQSFVEAFNELAALIRTQLKKHITTAELSVLISGGPGGPLILYPGSGAKGKEYRQLQNRLNGLRGNISLLVAKYGRGY